MYRILIGFCDYGGHQLARTPLKLKIGKTFGGGARAPEYRRAPGGVYPANYYRRRPHKWNDHMTASIEHLTGLIERVSFRNAETGFAVLQVKVRGLHDLVAVVATLPEVTG